MPSADMTIGAISLLCFSKNFPPSEMLLSPHSHPNPLPLVPLPPPPPSPLPLPPPPPPSPLFLPPSPPPKYIYILWFRLSPNFYAPNYSRCNNNWQASEQATISCCIEWKLAMYVCICVYVACMLFCFFVFMVSSPHYVYPTMSSVIHNVSRP